MAARFQRAEHLMEWSGIVRLNSPTAVALASVLTVAAFAGRTSGEGVSLRAEPLMQMVADSGRGAELLQGMRISRGDAAVLSFAESPGLPVRVMVPLDGRGVTLDLVPKSVRAEGFQVRAEVLGVRGVREWVDVDPGAVKTYEGTVAELPGAKVSAFVDGGSVTARIEVPGLPGAYWVEPDRSGAVVEERGVTGVVHAGYHTLDVVDGAGVCMTGDAGAPMLHARAGDGNQVGERGGCAAAVCVAELACDADFEYFQSYGSVSATAAQIERVVGVMNQQYLSEVGIRHRITTILVRTVSGSPYTSVNGGGLLVQMRDDWNANQTGIVRDLAQLFTAKALSGSVQGVAILGTVCDPSQAYSMVRSDCCGGLAGATDLSAHELGHIWGASHCACSFPNPDSTMNASLTGRNSFVTDLSGSSVASILAARNGAACLSEETPAAAPGAFALVSPGDGAFGVGLPIVLTWAPSSGVQFYNLTLSLNADLSSPLVSYATHDLTFTVPGLLNAQATRYYWKVEAWNGDSVKTVGTPGVGVFTTVVPPAACPGDFSGDNLVNTIDLTLLIGRFGQLVNPGQNGDMNGDGRVTTVDLTAFLGRFGDACP